MTFTKRALAAGLAFVALAGAAACSDDSSSQPDAAPATSEANATTTTATSTTSDSTTSDDTTKASGDCAANPGETVTVEIPDFKFDPNPVTVHVCDSIVWKNTHDQPHTATGDGDFAWNTGTIAPGASSEPVVFDQAGQLTYICAFHPFMKGSVEVS